MGKERNTGRNEKVRQGERMMRGRLGDRKGRWRERKLEWQEEKQRKVIMLPLSWSVEYTTAFTTGCFKKRFGIFSIFTSVKSFFAWNFANLLAIHIHVYLPIFIARQHTDVRFDIANLSVCLSVRPSVRLSVRNIPVSDKNGLTYRHSFFTIR